MRELIKIIILSITFTVVIFFINYNFFWDINKNITNNIAEEKYIDVEIIKKEQIWTKNENDKKIIDYYKEKNQIKYLLSYIPLSYRNNIVDLETKIIYLLENNLFSEKLNYLKVILIEEKIDRRWKMKNKSIELFWAQKEITSEYISVFIHELWHYIDLYFLEKKVFIDISDKFYKISWETTKVKKENQTVKDFVSWYSMTNKYEDFSESFTYYILHNKDFLENTKKSPILKQKYDFFSNYLFKNKEFFNSKFNELEIQNYYRDITKIHFDNNKLINYLEKISK